MRGACACQSLCALWCKEYIDRNHSVGRKLVERCVGHDDMIWTCDNLLSRRLVARLADECNDLGYIGMDLLGGAKLSSVDPCFVKSCVFRTLHCILNVLQPVFRKKLIEPFHGIERVWVEKICAMRDSAKLFVKKLCTNP